MKRAILLFSVLTMALAAPTQAKVIKHYGVIGGLTSSDHTWGGWDGMPTLEDMQKRQSGFHAGAFLEWFDIRYFSVITELLYNQKGAGLEWWVATYDESMGTGELFTAHARLDYLSLAILAKANIPSTVVSPYVVAGPRLDILLGHASDHFLSMASIYEFFDPTVLGISIGAGVQTHRLFSMLSFVEFRYDFDLHDSYREHCLQRCTSYKEIKNSSFEISAGVGF